MIDAIEIEHLIRATVPDVSGLPVYVSWASDLYDRSILSAGARGWSGRTLDLTMKPHLQHRELWAGRGPCIVIDDELILSDAKKVARPGQLSALHDEGVIAVVVHEFAHHLEEPFELSEPDFENVEIATETSAFAARLWSNFPSDVPSWYAHEAMPFMRNALHLRHRFQRAGVSVPVPYIIGGDRDISDCWAYSIALNDEPERLAGASFAEIRNTPPPEQFVQRWRDDVIESFNQRPLGRWGKVCLDELDMYKKEAK